MSLHLNRISWKSWPFDHGVDGDSGWQYTVIYRHIHRIDLYLDRIRCRKSIRYLRMIGNRDKVSTISLAR